MTQQEPKHFILDTTELRGQRRLESGHLRLLVHARKLLKDSVSIPEVSLLEHVRHIREGIEKDAADLTRAAQNLSRVRGKEMTVPTLNVEEETAAWATWAREQLARLGINVLPLPSPSHEALLRRDLERRKPFDNDGKGYRDALIWESVVTAAKEAPTSTVVFITQNVSDFVQCGELHPHLLEDCSKEGIEPGRIVHANGLKDAIDRHVAKRLPPPDAVLAEHIQKDAQPGGQFRRWIETSLAGHIGRMRLGKGELVEAVRVHRVKWVTNLVVREARRMGDETFAEADAELTVDLTPDVETTLTALASAQPSDASLGTVLKAIFAHAVLTDVRMTVRFAITVASGGVPAVDVWEAAVDPKHLAEKWPFKAQ